MEITDKANKRDHHKMRKKNKKQLPLMESGVDHPRVAELEAISRIPDNNPATNELVLQDLARGIKDNADAGQTA